MIDRARLARALRDVGMWPNYPEWTNVWREHANKIADAYEALELTASFEDVPMRGEVGQIVGPPIAGTDDTDNAGPAPAVEGEVIGDSEGVVSKPPPGRWKPAGEVGVITGSGTSVVEEPKNDARPAIKQVGPGDTDAAVDAAVDGRGGANRA